MKKIDVLMIVSILILMLTVFLFVSKVRGRGRDWQDAKLDTPIFKTGDVWITPGPRPLNEVDWGEDYFIFAFLYLYSEYEKECYADSTQEALYYNPDGSIFSSNYHGDSIVNMITGTVKWGHREPTLQGFMEFLRKQTDK